ncbi:MAG: acylneuraminate cytidylyltransferase family protein [Planctomycetota bacterium]
MILCIVPARGGSKGVPGKNLKKVGGRSLIAHAVKVGMESVCDEVALSTDSPAYAREGLKAGAHVPCLRPGHLAKDSTPMMGVIQHMVAEIEKEGERVDIVVLLQPTSPLRTAKDVDRSIKLLKRSRADSVVSVVRVPDHYNPCTILWQGKKGLYFPLNKDYKYSRRQDMPPAWIRNGAIYVFRRELLKRRKSTFFGEKMLPYEMDPRFHVNIDAPEDLKKARSLWSLFAGVARTRGGAGRRPRRSGASSRARRGQPATGPRGQ